MPTRDPDAYREFAEQAIRLAPTHTQERYRTDPAFREAWLSPDTDYRALGTLSPDELTAGVVDESVDLLIGNIDAELYVAWRRINADVAAGVSLDKAVRSWGIRGHPQFAEWFPVTPPPWGDERLARAILAERAEARARGLG